MTYVYLLSVHEEHGAESVQATLVQEKLPELLKKLCHTDNYEFNLESLNRLLQDTSLELLAAETTDMDGQYFGSQGHQIGKGWGSVQLHVVRLY